MQDKLDREFNLPDNLKPSPSKKAAKERARLEKEQELAARVANEERLRLRK